MYSVEEDLHEAGYPEAVNEVETCISARRSQQKNSAVQTANTTRTRERYGTASGTSATNVSLTKSRLATIFEIALGTRN